MKRIIVLGNMGSGKSSFAIKLGKKLNIPVFNIDRYFHNPDWTRVDQAEWEKRHENFIGKEKWIIDGNYKKTLDKRLDRADTVIFLDYPKLPALFRIIKRRIKHSGKNRPDMPEGYKENLSFRVILKLIRFSKRRLISMVNNHKIQLVELKNTKEINDFLENII